MKRRDFLSYSLLAAGAQFAPFALSKANAFETFDPSKKKFFVMVRMSGGWDVTLGLDPKIHQNGSDQNDMFIEYSSEVIQDAAGVKLGPAAVPLVKHKGGFSVVNGLITATQDNGHEANGEYVASGNGEGKAPHLPVEIAMATERGPLGVVFEGSTTTLDRDVMVSSLGSVQALKHSLKLKDFADFIRAGQVSDSFKAAQIAMLNGGEELDALIKNLDAIKSEPNGQAAIIAATFLSGTAFQAELSINLGLDTHAGHETLHLNEQKRGWEQISQLFDVFKAADVGGGLSLFDRTVFMVTSEFARTPALNTSKGKDHNPLTNSVLLGGGGVVGGKVVGESHLITRARSLTGAPIHSALPMNFATGEMARTKAQAQAGGFKYIVPETIAATVATAMQVDWNKFRSVDRATPILNSLIKSNW